MEQSSAAIYRIGGWYDGALSKSVFEGLWNTSNTKRILMGPWDHGPADNASPHSPTKEVTFDVKAEMLRFFDHYLKGIENGINLEKPVQYFTIAEEAWKSADTWPPAGQTNLSFYLSANQTLVNEPADVQQGKLNYLIDTTTTTGNSSRWNSQTALFKNGPTHYPDRREQSEKLLHFTTAPFSSAVELTGEVIADLYFSADATDASVFCYIEDVAPDGSITYVTEGLFRALHRKVSENTTNYKQAGPFHSFRKEDALPLIPGETARLHFDLLPISYLFKPGHSLRLAIGGSDLLHFDHPDDMPSALTINCNENAPSKIIIPVAARKDITTGSAD